MITTVTTVTTVTTIAALGLTTFMGMVAVLTLLVFLVIQELVSAGRSYFSLRMAKFVSVGIVPLTIAFVVIVTVEIVKAL